MDIKKNQLFTLVLPSIFYCISFNNYFFFSFHSFNFFLSFLQNSGQNIFQKMFCFQFSRNLGTHFLSLLSNLRGPIYSAIFRGNFNNISKNSIWKKIFLKMHCHNLSTEIIFFLSQITQSIVVCNAYQSVLISINTKKC